MKHVLKLVIFAVLTLIVSCQTDYSGTETVNKAPVLEFSSYDSTKLYLTKKKTRVSWYANDMDGVKMTYYYVVTPDSTVNSSNLLDRYPFGSSFWKTTTNSYADVSFLVDGSNLKKIYFADPDPNNPPVEYTRSKIFIYSQDENGNRSKVIHREYWRTNTRPAYPKVECPSFNWTALLTYKFGTFQSTALPRLFLPEQTIFWQPVGFRWRTTDADGGDVALEFKWEVRKLKAQPGSINITGVNSTDSATVTGLADTLISESQWSETNVELGVTSQLLDGPGYYKFIVRVKDDAGQESTYATTSFFEAFNPEFNKGIMVLDRTLEEADLPGSGLQKGYPHHDSVTVFYKALLDSAGYHPAVANDPEPLKSYSYRRVNNGTIYQTKELTQYRMIYLVSDSRDSKENLFTTIIEGGFGSSLDLYTQMGGKVFVTGSNMVIGVPNDNGIYYEPVRRTDLSSLVTSKFGLASYTTGEGYEGTVSSNWHNYDFIGTKSFTHTPDLVDMKVSPQKINKWWTKRNSSGSIDFIIKGNGIFLPGVSTISSANGEIIFGYKSVYNDPVLSANTALVTAGGPAGQPTKPVLDRNQFDGLPPGANSAIGNRFIAPFDAFRTAYIGLPLYFMDDSEGAVTHNFKAMLKWFELNKNPLDNQKK